MDLRDVSMDSCDGCKFVANLFGKTHSRRPPQPAKSKNSKTHKQLASKIKILKMMIPVNSKTKSPLSPLSSFPNGRGRAPGYLSVSLVNVIRQSSGLSMGTLNNLFTLFHWESADVQSFLHDTAAKLALHHPLQVVRQQRRTHSRKVSSFTSFRCEGKYIQSFKIQGPGQLHFAEGCALSVDACHLYVTDAASDNHCVSVYDASSGAYRHSFGSWGSGPGQFKHPAGVWASDTGQLYVCDRDRVQVLDGVTGAYVRTIGTGVSGSGPGQLYIPFGVVKSRQRVYVCEWGNHRVSVFNESNGAFLHSFGTYGTHDGQFTYCRYITASALSGDVYVVDGDFNNTRRVQVFSETGEFRRVLCSTATHGGVISGVIRTALSVCVSATDDVYVGAKHCVHLFDKSGAYLRAICGGDRASSAECSTSISRDGRLFVVDNEHDRVCVFE